MTFTVFSRWRFIFRAILLIDPRRDQIVQLYQRFTACRAQVHPRYSQAAVQRSFKVQILAVIVAPPLVRRYGDRDRLFGGLELGLGHRQRGHQAEDCLVESLVVHGLKLHGLEEVVPNKVEALDFFDMAPYAKEHARFDIDCVAACLRQWVSSFT